MPAAAEVQAATIDQFISGWRKWTPSDFLASFSNDCTQTALPFGSGKPTRSREDLDRLFPILMSTLSNFKLTVHNIVHDPAQSKAAIYAMTEADCPFIEYKNEQAVFLWFNEAGEVNKIEEMFDSAFMDDFHPKFREYMAQKAQAQA